MKAISEPACPVLSASSAIAVAEELAAEFAVAIEGWTLVIVTHEIQFARQVSDQVLFIDEGVVLEPGPPCEVIEAPSHQRTRQFLDRVLNPL